MTETIFGMSGCFSVSQGQEMKDLTASSGCKATSGCQKPRKQRLITKNVTGVSVVFGLALLQISRLNKANESVFA